MKLTTLSLALVAALGTTTGCSMQAFNQASTPAVVATDAEAQYALGRYYQGQERYEQAIQAYRLALAANPAHAGANNALGASLLLAGRNAEAIEQFKAGLRHQPRSAALWNNLGYAYALNGEAKLAEFAYQQSLDIDPRNDRTATNLAMIRQSSPEATPATVASPAPAETVKTAESAVPNAPVIAPPTVAKADMPSPPANPISVVQSAPEQARQAMAIPVKTVEASMSAKPEISQPEIAKPLAKVQMAPELAGSGFATEASTVQVAQVAPRVFELKLTEARPAPVVEKAVAVTAATMPAPVIGAKQISVPVRDDTIKTASVGSNDFVLEIRNGNGVRRMAWRTSQYLAEQGYATKRLTNERGFNVQVTQVLYLPGYLAEAEGLRAHLPKETVFTETTHLRRGTHVRVVLGKDMVEKQASLDATPPKIQLAALQR